MQAFVINHLIAAFEWKKYQPNIMEDFFLL